MLAMLTPCFRASGWGLLGVAGHVPPPAHPAPKQASKHPDFDRWIGGLVGGLGNAANARKKTSGNGGNGWASGCATPPNRTTEPLHPLRTHPPFWRVLEEAGRPNRGAVQRFFFACRPNFFFFFLCDPRP